MAATKIGSSPLFGKIFKNAWSVSKLDITYLISNRDTLAVPTTDAGVNPNYDEASVTFTVVNQNNNVDSDWVIAEYASPNTTITVNDTTKTVTVTALTADTGSFTIQATKSGENTLYKKISVYKAKAGAQGETGDEGPDGPQGIQGIQGNPGIDGTDGIDGDGWTGGSYDPGTGIVTFTSNDGLGFLTGDLRGSSGVGGTIQNGNRSIQPIDDGTPSGDTRGTSSLDLQTARLTSDAVASGNYCVVPGGYSNTASANYSVVSGGLVNTATGASSTISGGEGNVASAEHASISGGSQNTASAVHSAIGGGYNNTNSSINGIISGGSDNTVSGDYSSSLGSYNIVPSDYSTVIGTGGTSTTNGEIVLSSSNSGVQKSIYILEGTSVGTTPMPLATLKRGSGGVESSLEYIQVTKNTAFHGTLDIIGVKDTLSNDEIIRRKTPISWTCDGSGNVTVKQGGNPYSGSTVLTDYSVSDYSILSISTYNGTNIIWVEIEGGVGTTINWSCIIEGVVTDAP